MDRAAKRAVKRKQAELMNKRAQITVKDQWNGDGTVTRTVSIDESNPTDAQLLMQMLSIKPPEADEAADKGMAPAQAEEAEQAPATQVDDQTGDQTLRTETGKKKSKIAVETLMDRVDGTGRDFSALDNEELQQLFDDADQNGISQEERASIYNELSARGIQVFSFKKKADRVSPGDRFETTTDIEFTSDNIVPAGTMGTVVRERPDILADAIAVTFDGMEDYGELVIKNDTFKIKKTAMKRKAGYSVRNDSKDKIESLYNSLQLSSTNDPNFRKPPFNKINDQISVGDNGLVTVFTGKYQGHPFGPDDYLNAQDAGQWYELEGAPSSLYDGSEGSEADLNSVPSVAMKKKAGSSQYLQTFFEEKNLPYASWELTDNQGDFHSIDNEVVIEAIMGAPENEQDAIADMIRKIDFANGDVNDYLKHLAQGLINGGRAGVKKKADDPEYGMPMTYRDYKCRNCGHVQPIQTNHTGPVIDYCQECSWKPSFGDDEAIPFNGRTYRNFDYAGKESYSSLKRKATVDMDGNELSRGDTVVLMEGSAPGVAKGKIISLPYNQPGTSMVHVLTEDYDPQTGWQEEDWNSAMVRKTAGRIKTAKVFELTRDQVEVDTWFERDRQHVDLRDKETGETIMEWWDEAVTEAVEDGFLDPGDWEGSAYDYAKQMGMIKEPEPIFE